MKYAVNLALLTALGTFRSTDVRHADTLASNMLAVYNDNQDVPPVFCCSNSYTLAIGVDNAEIKRPAQLVKLWDKLSGVHKALVSLDDLDAVNKLAPKGKKERELYTKTVLLNVEADGTDEQVAWLSNERFNGQQTRYRDSFPNISSLLYLGEDKREDGTSMSGALSFPLPTQDVAFDPDVLGKVLKIAKMFDTNVVFHGRAGGQYGQWGKTRHYWSVRDGNGVLIVGVIMPVNQPSREWVES